MALELSPIDAPEKPRNEYDDAFDYLKEIDPKWAQVVIDADDVRKTKRGLSQAAKREDRSLKYDESAPDKNGKVTLSIGLKPYVSPEERQAKAEARAARKAEKSQAPGAAPTVPEVAPAE